MSASNSKTAVPFRIDPLGPLKRAILDLLDASEKPLTVGQLRGALPREASTTERLVRSAAEALVGTGEARKTRAWTLGPGRGPSAFTTREEAPR